MTPEDIQRELDRLWGKVTAGTPSPMPSAPPAPPDPAQYSLHDAPSITREATMETLSLVKRQHRAEVLRLAQLLELKERSLAETSERLRLTLGELERLRRRTEGSDAVAMQQAVSFAAEMEAADKARQALEARMADEEARLRAAAEEARRRAASEEARWHALESDWNTREQEYLLRLRELETRAEKTREEASACQGAEQRALAELSEAKKAVEASLSGLLQERREREEADSGRERALQRVKDVEERMNQLQNLWTEERKQWQELWERERSGWEAKKQEMAAWEERVHKDKEAFHQKFGELEERETKHAESMTEILRRSSDAGERIGDFMREAAGKVAELARLSPPPAAAPAPARRFDWRWAAAGVLVLALGAASVPAWRWMHRLEFTLLASSGLAAQRPTSIAFDGDALWVAEWEGRLEALDPEDPAQALKPPFVVAQKDAYHPAGLSVWAGKIYTLDTAQGRILRHPQENPSKVEAAWPTPGPAPVSLAHDGRNLWSYDAATKVLYRHLGEGSEAQTEQFKVDADVVLTALRWHKDELWGWDAKGKRVLVMRLEGRGFEIAQSAPLPAMPGGAQSLLLTYRALPEKDKQKAGVQQLQLWALTTDPAGEPLLKKFAVRR
ncbi:hypothetical protein EPO15_17295 [bacterium]|nr:MAG: hypothetical protein EPO15_17295 [bacterium]